MRSKSLSHLEKISQPNPGKGVSRLMSRASALSAKPPPVTILTANEDGPPEEKEEVPIRRDNTTSSMLFADDR